VVTIAMIVATLASVSVVNDTADARGPSYNGPSTQADGPALFGPAPNPFPYCDSPTYFDPFPENVNPIGRMDLGSTATVTTGAITMNLEVTSEGVPGDQYPGFFPSGGEGSTNDRAKGIELGQGDGARITLTDAAGNPAPLFYSQWIFTDVDRPGEGFTVTPAWTQPGQAAVFGGDNDFTFEGTTNLAVELDESLELDPPNELSQALAGRVQVDFLGAVTGIDMLRTFPSEGQSGFAVGGGCEAAGAAKVVTSGPTWNGTGFEVTYDLRVRNNLPSSATIQAVLDDAVSAFGAQFVTSTPQGIILENLQLTDDLRDDAFSSIVVTERSTNGGLVLNDNFDGQTDFDLISAGAVAAEQNEIITLTVEYTPDLATANWSDCGAGYNYLNQTELTGTAANVDVADLSDDGVSARPGDNNGAGGVDDPTPVNFPCPPGGLQIVKTVVDGPEGVCPTFANGTLDDGPALPVTVGDIVTYCLSVLNTGPGPVSNIRVTDAQAPGVFNLSNLNAGETDSASYDVAIQPQTPTLNTATVNGTDAAGAVTPDSDTAVIAISELQPVLEIVKTAVPGPGGTCPERFAAGTPDDGDAVDVLYGDVVTFCITVLNSGQNQATGVTITDLQAPAQVSLGTLDINEQKSTAYDVTVTATTPVQNTATANGTGPTGALPPASDTALISTSPQPDPVLEIVKTVVPGPEGTCPANFLGGTPDDGDALIVSYGDTVTFCISVRNVGGSDASNVTVVDAQAPTSITLGTIAVGGELDDSYDVVVDESTELQNTATATGIGPNGDTAPVADTALIAPADPVLNIVKTVVNGPLGDCPVFANGIDDEGDALAVRYDDTVTYCITVRNSGGNAATNVSIADSQAPGGGFDVGTVPAGEERTLSYDVIIDAGTPDTNVATATGQGPTGDLGPVSDPAIIDPSPQLEPGLEIVKTVVPGPEGTCPTFEDGVRGRGEVLEIELGDTVTYCLAIRNTGLGVASNVQITDDQSPLSPYAINVLQPGDGEAVQFDVLVDLETEFVNVATVTGTGPTGPLPQASDDAEINHDTPAPNITLIHSVAKADEECLTVAKDLNSLVANVIDTDVEWCARVVNAGNVALINVRLTSPELGIADFDVLAGRDSSVLQPGEEVLISVPGTIAAGGLASNGSVTGDPADINGNRIDLEPVSDADDAEVREASVDLETTVVAGETGDCADATESITVPTGSIVTWCFTATNTGTVSLLITEVEDITLGIIIQVPDGEQIIAPGESFVVSTTSAAPQDGIVNEARVEGQPLDENDDVLDQAPIVEDDDPATIDTTVADSAVSKTNSNAGPIGVGVEVTYTIVVSNNGPHAADNVRVIDELSAGLDYVSVPSSEGWDCSLDEGERSFTCLRDESLANGDSDTLTYVAVANGSAVAGSDLVNTATVESPTKDPDDSNNTDTSTTRTRVPPPFVPDPRPEYPGPFDPPTPLLPPDEVLGLAITGSATNLLGLLSAVLLALGGMLTVTGRRRRSPE